MMRNIKFVTLCFLVLLFSFNCGKIQLFKKSWRITVKNSSEEHLMILDLGSYYDKKKERFEGIPLYPDTNLPDQIPFLISLPPGVESHIDFPANYDEVFESLPSGLVSVFAFDKDTISAFSWSKIKGDYKVFRRYDWTKEDLEKLNYTVTF